jgi:hypothetical protein
MTDRKQREAPEASSAADDLGLGLPAELPAPELQEAPGLKRHGDPLRAAARAGGSSGASGDGLNPQESDPTAQADGDDGDPGTGARRPAEIPTSQPER